MAISLTVVKGFGYRGNNEEWSNRYHFTGSTPADAAAWLALSDALVALERPAFTSGITWRKVYGYTADGTSSVWQKDYTTGTLPVGTLTLTGAARAAGDAAAWIRWRAHDQLNSNGRPVYLRKYFHGVNAPTSGTDAQDTFHATQRSAFATLGAALINTSSFPSARVLCGPTGILGESPAVCQFITTRTLKRRGPNPT